MGYIIWTTICGVAGFFIGLKWYVAKVLLSTLIGIGVGVVTSIMAAGGGSGGGFDFDLDFD